MLTVWDPIGCGNIEGGRGGQPFYLSFLPDDARRFSFSSFIGMRALPQDEERRVREGLSRFDGLSVREARTQEYLMSLGLEAKRHVDPTLAIPSQYCAGYPPPRSSAVLTLPFTNSIVTHYW